MPSQKNRIDSAGMSKVDIVRAVQRKEGNFDCFATAYEVVCSPNDCLWRDDCIATSARWLTILSKSETVVKTEQMNNLKDVFIVFLYCSLTFMTKKGRR